MNPTQSLLSNKATVMKITTFSNKNTPVLPRRKPRPVSTGEIIPPKSNHIKMPLSDDESSLKSSQVTSCGGQPNKQNQLSLMMYVIGGRVGQVTVFNGPISLWKLDLTKTF